ncbi:hypothetical protein D8B26_001729 [Coccidioides posadasii str. Silveira]|uniref:Uncharacterized protein n=2 Tax=Coccidioides posadasii TaxID=199306 RepID=E9CW77_COCPS|nr:hypothetical protein CPC735_049710 [Coccidioides posadasii C735 delta SOWgp]EER23601.1 hypothetical protein CPC735_049710 [Coccidioides posadasii C735 delta SOWgp]EFW21553.1 conserved hypothetical protein [Coccidioides posadasii str. Silveira]QVM07026.1 hypothetical protein D8B26_001729 [Coccidioides posadasii str. Silveira]|eukprot:XP_003065746.1 hypothetical protein CPC735_049710 [Coccidioides posadasii C735 delta SOWgp]
MESSPLTQQTRPEAFQPKIVQLYENLLFNPDYVEPTEGFWREFLLLPPDRPSLAEMLNRIGPDDMLHIQAQTQRLFARAIRESASGKDPVNSHALETLSTFLGGVLSKKYTNPSADIITILAGLHEVDQVFSEFVSVLDGIIRNGTNLDLRSKAVDAAIAITSGAYKTGLISYFMHRDLFPSLMKLVHDSDTPMQIFKPFLLLGLLANYNKFEFQNPYQLRLDDFVNEATISKIVRGVGNTCSILRNSYVAVQDDLPEGWTWSGTLAFFGLGVLAGRSKTQPLTTEEIKERFAELPSFEAAVLLSMYEFINANKLFSHSLVLSTPEKRSEESPFSSFLSLTSYMLQHAYRSVRVALYSEANLLSLQILVEDPVLCKQICSDENKRSVRLCRQRTPHLPLVNGDRVLATVIFDIMIDTITHNLRKSLDVFLYSHVISIILRLLTYVSANKTRLQYHWSELWRSLLTLVRFLTTYATDLSSDPNIHLLTTDLINLLAFCISAGDTFLPDPASYDDLFYKLVEAGPILSRFREVYKTTFSAPSKAPNGKLDHKSSQSDSTKSLALLLRVSTHFHSLLFLPEKQKEDTTTESTVPTIHSNKKKNLSPREVHSIIKEGYATLSIEPQEGLSNWEKWREADWKPRLKRIGRTAVDDSRTLVATRGEGMQSHLPVTGGKSIGAGGEK